MAWLSAPTCTAKTVKPQMLTTGTSALGADSICYDVQLILARIFQCRMSSASYPSLRSEELAELLCASEIVGNS